ncbi:hypothetical protein JKI95_11955 [Corynebacterium aquatimens]|nr:hypothetical protein [Corynebacterium sp. CNCTC7651]QYH20401.1 hypothetical protein JKI95_00030 [Corynebacterium aquatimens]QYH20579.1 hypothetical protein JKI95_11955 [Corynebacterium aquatimens]UIZ91345.1 hypothetical protein JZY91_06025 [Corynebacterium sp. CNCTC7651]
MQIRKGLVAAGTAAAVLTSGVTVASAQPVVNNKEAVTKTVSTTDSKASSSSQDGKKISPKEIQEWIAVVTALIGLLGTIASFANKYIKP